MKFDMMRSLTQPQGEGFAAHRLFGKRPATRLMEASAKKQKTPARRPFSWGEGQDKGGQRKLKP
jgi:hypothetical protein